VTTLRWASVGVPGRAMYHAGKHGVIGLTKSAALEIRRRKAFRSMRYAHGIIDTPMVSGCYPLSRKLWKR